MVTVIAVDPVPNGSSADDSVMPCTDLVGSPATIESLGGVCLEDDGEYFFGAISSQDCADGRSMMPTVAR